MHCNHRPNSPGCSTSGAHHGFFPSPCPELFLIPRGCQWDTVTGTRKIQSKYAILGIGQPLPQIILADGFNEMGFAAAALYFPGFAQYDAFLSQKTEAPAVAALELVKFLLSRCACVEQAVSLLQNIRIVGTKDPVTNTIAPLHWLLTDAGGACLVVEKTAEGLLLLPDPIGVLSNSPGFNWHLTNLRNYLNVAPSPHSQAAWDSVNLIPFGQGNGTFGLPGDYTPPSRFVRAAYHKSHTFFPARQKDAIVGCFHLLDTVSIPRGCVTTNTGASDYTQYTAVMDLSAREYFFKTYDNSQITAVKLPTRPNFELQAMSFGKLVQPIHFDRRTLL